MENSSCGSILPLTPTHHGVIDFGAGNPVYEEEELLTRVEQALAPYPNVILLLPSPDPDESVEILKSRLIHMLTEAGKGYTDELFELNEYFLKYPSNRRLAKLVIYTRDKTPETARDEIVQKLVQQFPCSAAPSPCPGKRIDL